MIPGDEVFLPGAPQSASDQDGLAPKESASDQDAPAPNEEGPTPAEAPTPGEETTAADASVPLPGGEAPPPGGEAPPAAASPESPDRARWVAVLIMVVTLLGAVFAFLQNGASSRSAAAARRADAAAVEAEGEAVRAAQHLGALWRVWTIAFEEAQIGLALGWSGESGAAALGAAYQAAAQASSAFVGFDLLGEFGPEWQRLFTETWASTLRAGEFQKAHASERSAWGAKGSQYVAVTTVLAVALFLLGLSRTQLGASSGRLLVWSGLAVAGAAVLWGLVVLLRPVAPPSAEAIDAYVDGQVTFGAALSLQDVEGMQQAEEAFTRALAARAGYSDAYFARGLARAQLGLFDAGGPQGSEGAREDFERVVALDPLNQVAWSNLALARLRLGEADGSVAALRRAVEIRPDDPAANLNLGACLLLSGDEAGYRAQLAAIRAIFAGGAVSDSLRMYLFDGTWRELELAKQRLPEASAAAGRGQEDLLRLDHQIRVGREYFGTADPAPVGAEVSPLTFALSGDGTRLEVAFDATGVAAGQRWLWRTYRAGVAEESLSSGPEAWPFGVPDGPGSISLTAPEGFAAGVTVRVEVFLEGNLLQAGEYTP